ncbi:MAG: alpha/beta hydrolase-fold protein [Candidatus Eisenbacteria bacterium]
MKRGRVTIVDFESEVLRGNPAGDPHVRRIPVYLPPSYDDSPAKAYPVLHVLSGFTGRGRMLLNDSTFSPSLDDRLDALIAAGACEECIVVMPDCWTRYGGSQYLDSTATGRYATHLCEELVPWVDAHFRTRAGREHRGVAGKSSGGYGALVLGMRRPDLFGAVACHSGDLYFDYCYRPELPEALGAIQRAGDVRAFLEKFERATQKGKHEFAAYNTLGMAAAYSPDPSAELGIALPFDLDTGAFREDVWARWLEHDPLRHVEACADALRSLKLLYLDCGTRDEYHLHHGARMFARELARLGVPHVHQEFEDGHMNVGYRYDVSLPLLTRALAG